MEGVYEFSPRNSHSRPSPRYDLGILSQSNAPSRPRPHTQPHATQLVHRAATPTHDVGCSAPRTSTPSSGDCPFPNPAPVLPRFIRAHPCSWIQDVSPVLHQREGRQGLHHQEGVASWGTNAVCSPGSLLTR